MAKLTKQARDDSGRLDWQPVRTIPRRIRKVTDLRTGCEHPERGAGGQYIGRKEAAVAVEVFGREPILGGVVVRRGRLTYATRAEARVGRYREGGEAERWGREAALAFFGRAAPAIGGTR